MGEPNFDKQIDYILNNFDFQKVVTAMRALGWTWAMNGGVNAVPSVENVKEKAQALLVKMVSEFEDHAHSIETGGLRASIYPSGYLELDFVIESESGIFSGA